MQKYRGTEEKACQLQVAALEVESEETHQKALQMAKFLRQQIKQGSFGNSKRNCRGGKTASIKGKGKGGSRKLVAASCLVHI